MHEVMVRYEQNERLPGHREGKDFNMSLIDESSDGHPLIQTFCRPLANY